MNTNRAAIINQYQPLEHNPYLVDNKIDLILVLAGAKRASEWHVFSPDAPTLETAIPILPTELSRLEMLFISIEIPFSSLGQALIERGSDDIPSFVNRVVYRLAHSQSDLSLIEQVWNNPTGYPTDRVLHGQLSGFPQTAIDAFVGKPQLQLPPYSLPTADLFSPAYAFARFVLSKDHWQTELKTSAHWADIIQQWAPDLYDTRIRQIADQIRRYQANV